MANNDIHEGGCLCGAMRYRVAVGTSRTVTHCFCRMCRKANGGTFITWVEFPANDFVFTKGQPCRFRSSDLAERTFCGRCGCQLTFQAVGDPKGPNQSIWIALGSTDRPGDVKPTHHIFTANRPPWLHLDDRLPRWPSQLPWIRQEDELPSATVPEKRADRQWIETKSGEDNLEGGCLCGSVRYRGVVGDPGTAGHCHCGMCRKSTGATLVSWVNVPAKGFAFSKGQPRRFRSSHNAERMFCETCGCQLAYQFVGDLDDNSMSLWVTLGSTDRPGDIEPVYQIFTDERISWLHLADSLTCWPDRHPGVRSDDNPSSRAGVKE